MKRLYVSIVGLVLTGISLNVSSVAYGDTGGTSLIQFIKSHWPHNRANDTMSSSKKSISKLYFTISKMMKNRRLSESTLNPTLFQTHDLAKFIFNSTAANHTVMNEITTIKSGNFSAAFQLLDSDSKQMMYKKIVTLINSNQKLTTLIHDHAKELWPATEINAAVTLYHSLSTENEMLSKVLSGDGKILGEEKSVSSDMTTT